MLRERAFVHQQAMNPGGPAHRSSSRRHGRAVIPLKAAVIFCINVFFASGRMPGGASIKMTGMNSPFLVSVI
jgi:hypothetical protein